MMLRRHAQEPAPGRPLVDMGEELEKLQRAFDLSGADDDQDLGPGSADTSETNGIAVPLPDDLEPNLKLLLSALEKEGNEDTVEMMHRLQEQLEWLSSQKERAAATTQPPVQTQGN